VQAQSSNHNLLSAKTTLVTDVLAFIVLANALQSALVQVIIFFKSSPELDLFAMSMWVMSNGLIILSTTLISSIVLTSLLASALLKILRSGKLSYVVVLAGSALLLIAIVTPVYAQIKYWEVNLYGFEYLNIIRDLAIGSVILLVPRYWLKPK